MRNGIVSPRPPLAPLTGGTGSGLWPTPNVSNGGRSLAHVTDWRGRSAYHNGKKVQVGLESAVRMVPTPTVNDSRSGANATATRTNPDSKHHAGTTLVDYVRLWPTPTTQDASNNGGPSQFSRNSLPLNAAVGGALNPTWVEWLMGYPLGWTVCEGWATRSSRRSRPSSAS